MKKAPLLFILIFLIPGVMVFAQSDSHPVTISLSVSSEAEETFEDEGRLYVFLNENLNVEPMIQIWPFPGSMSRIFAMNRQGLSPDESVILDPDADWNSTVDWTFDNIPEGEYNIQVLWDQDESESRINAPGNLHSEKHRWRTHDFAAGIYRL